MNYYEPYEFGNYKKFRLESCYSNRLADLCKKNGFIRKGTAFFRIHGDGVFQSIAFRYTSHFWHYSLNFTILSLYNDYAKYTWAFSPMKSVFHHSICKLINHRMEIEIDRFGDIPGRVLMVYPNRQLDILESVGFNYFDSINTQEKLVKTLCNLDNVGINDEKDHIIWGDWHKLAPFLCCNDYKNADRVICAHLWRGINSRYFSEKQIGLPKPPWTEDAFLQYSPWFKAEDEEYVTIHRWITNNDTVQIQSYLKANYERNLQRAKFCIGTRAHSTD